MRTVVMLFTRDLRVHDNPALAPARETAADRVVPLFVRDPALRRSPVRDRVAAGLHGERLPALRLPVAVALGHQRDA